MRFFRLIKPDWAKKSLANGDVNPKFVREISGENTIEGCNFTDEFVRQKNQEGYNVYFFPNHPSVDVYQSGTKYLSGKMIDTFNFVFVDMDLKDGIYPTKKDFINRLSQFQLKPTIIVDSGNGVHAYWKVQDLSRDKYVLLQMALLNHFKTDDSVYTVLQLMRYPGSQNTKDPAQYKDVGIHPNSSNLSYTFDQFPVEIIKQTPPEKLVKVQNHLNRLDGKLEIQLNQDVNVDEIPEEFIELCDKDEQLRNLFNDPLGYNGDRSSADMKLANVLFNKNFPKKKALRVMANTQKALSKGAYRFDYAQITIDKAYVDRIKTKFMSVGEAIKQDVKTVLGEQVYGPAFLDYMVLEKPWRKKQILGLIAGSGVGKTAFALKIIKDMIENNEGRNDDVFVFVTLEMPESEIYERWIQLVGKESPLAYRLYVIGNEDEEGNNRNLGLQEIQEYCQDLKKSSGKNIGALVVDHFRIISSHIHIKKKETFGVFSEQSTGYGDIRNLSENKKADAMKILCKSLDTHLIMLTQTTKEKGVGDEPIGKDGAYGTSSFENIVDRLITLWQPLMRVQHMTPIRFLAWQYTKNRHLGKHDHIRPYEKKLLTYNMETGDLELTNEREYEIFKQYKPHADAAREATKKKQSQEYSIQVNLNEIDNALNTLGVNK